MKKTIAIALSLILLLCSCAVAPAEPVCLNAEQIAALREQYPLCREQSVIFDMEYPAYSEIINAGNEIYHNCIAVITVQSEKMEVKAEYALESGSAEEALEQKMTGSSTWKLQFVTWKATVDEIVSGEIPISIIDDDGAITIGSRTAFESLLPELEMGKQYILTLSITNLDWQKSLGYPEEVWHICEAGEVFYITEDGHVLSSLEAYQQYDGLPLERFCSQVRSMAVSK